MIAEDESGSRAQSARSYVLGFAVIVLAYMVPIIGILTYLMVGTFGLGSATMAFVARWRRERAGAAGHARAATAGGPDVLV